MMLAPWPELPKPTLPERKCAPVVPPVPMPSSVNSRSWLSSSRLLIRACTSLGITKWDTSWALREEMVVSGK